MSETEMTDAQMDELVARTDESPNREIPMTAEEAPAVETAKPQEDTYEFTHNGKQVKGTRDQLIKWAQQGYDYPQKAQALNQEKAKWDSQRSQWESQWGNYKQIDEWAKKNPQQWDSLKQQYEALQRGQTQPPADASNPYAQKISFLESKLNQVEPIVQQFVEQQRSAELKAQDEKLDQEVKSIREKYKDLDFDSPDETGKSLEFKVLEHAQKNGIPSFQTAFKDFYHDELVARAEAQAKQSVAKGIQQKTKLGILGESPAPKRGIQPATDIKNKSYEDLWREALEEARQGA